MHTKQDKCTVCGAKVTGRWCLSPNTCSNLCTRANRNGLTREQQTRVDMRLEARFDRQRDHEDRRWASVHRSIAEDENYNRPYLVAV